MKDALFVSDRGNVFSKAFDEHGFTCDQVSPGAFGSPFCSPCRMLIIPSGFADPKYYRILPSIRNNADRIREFIENGGVVLAFGAMLTDYDYDWLPMKLSYHMHFKEVDVKLVDPDDPAAKFIAPGKLDCDGFFTENDGNVVMVREENKPVLVTKKVGKGYIVAASLHQYPTAEFVNWACDESRPFLQI